MATDVNNKTMVGNGESGGPHRELKPFHRKFNREIEQRGLSQSKVGKLIGVTQGRVWKWMHGEGLPNGMQLVRMSRAFRVPLAYLADDEVDSPEQVKGDPGLMEHLPEDYKLIWGLIKEMGAPEAKRRLMQLPASTRGPVSE
jgi:transcriptional regulator with XRE-family HTH domain